MIAQQIHELQVPTSRRGFYEITSQVHSLVRDARYATGIASLFLRHTSASLLIQENADPEVRRDLERFFARLVPDGDPVFRHSIEGEDDMPSHVRTALTSVHLSVPILRGVLALGSWQGIYIWEHRQESNLRHVVVHLIGE